MDAIITGFGAWLYGQGVSTVLLLSLVFGLWKAMQWGAKLVREEIPRHLQSIQDGYEDIHKECAAERTQFAAERKETRELFERTLDKIVARNNSDLLKIIREARGQQKPAG